MNGPFAIALFTTLALAGASSTSAHEASHSCLGAQAALPSELTGWQTRQPATAGTGAADVDQAVLTPGSARDAALQPTTQVEFRAQPQKLGEPSNYAGLFTFTITHAGSYRVALGYAAWVDVVKDDVALVSTAHVHGPDCSGIRKIVDFSLTPGRYVVQIAGSGAKNMPIMVAQKP